MEIMKYDNLIKQLLTEDNSINPAGFRNFTFSQNTTERPKTRMDYSATQVKSHDPSEIDTLWNEFENMIGKAHVSTNEDLDEYLSLTDKVLVVNKRSPHAIVIPGPIAKDVLERGQDAVTTDIRQIAGILRNYMEMIGGHMEFSRFEDGSIAFFLEPIKSEENLPTSIETATNENIEFLTKWVNWIKQKRNESWIIASTDNDALIIE